jgi:hypothetical protein
VHGYIIRIAQAAQLGNVRKNSKNHDFTHLYAVKAACALALAVNGKYS